MIKIYQQKSPPHFFGKLDDLIGNNRKNELYSSYKESFEYKMLEYYNWKCVYCEMPSIESKLLIDYYRPITGALNVITGEFSDNHYRWLSREWSNFLVICEECCRSKSDRFPVNGSFAKLNSTTSELLKEKRLLINPFLDYPEKHFLYEENGNVIATSEKGKVTIDILNLNRSNLIHKRLIALNHFINVCDKFKNDNWHFERSVYLQDILNGINGLSPFTGIKRYYLTQLIRDDRMEYLEEFTPYLKDRIKKKNKIRISNPNRINFEKLPGEVIIEPIKDDDYDVTDDEDIAKYFYKQRYIEYFEIQNFKGIEYINIDFRSIKGENAPWMMILGENGFGKTSILQAISIALMGESKREEVTKGYIGNFVNYNEGTATIRIGLSGTKEPIELIFNKQGDYLGSKKYKKPLVLILAYGATRLLPINSNEYFGEKWARVENLFNPFIPMVDVRNYLNTLSNSEFEIVVAAIEELFFENVQISRNNNEIYFQFTNEILTIDNLSDGYKTTIALATDIMMVMKNRWRNYNAEGIVLIDELDAHLHPRWNIEIVSRLRKAFPKIQFITTTHNPLTLRGLKENEVCVLKKIDNKTVIMQDLPVQKEMKIEEMLTSNYFGLYDTNPEVNIYFEEYYKLLTNPEPNFKEQEKINKLKLKLERYNKLGLTKRDQLFYKAIDIYLAKQKQSGKDNMNLFVNKIEEIIEKIKGLE